MKPSELLRHGRARIEVEGLLKGKAASDTASFIGQGCCVQTSLNGVNAVPGDHEPACRMFRRANEIEGAPTYVSIIEWNDKPERTKEEVLAAFDKAIALAESEGQ